MIDKISKCTIVFTVGVTLSLASMAFFNEWMRMPMKMGQQMVMPQAQPCACKCLGENNGL
jgi:hypothetical protein